MKSMKFLFKITGLLLAIGIIISSCKKEEDEEEAPKKSNTEYLTSGQWEMTNIEGITPPFDTVDIWSSGFITSCEKDDYWDYKNDLSGKRYEGTKKCEPTDPDFIDFTWMWEDNESTLVYVTDTDTIYYKEVQLSDKGFVGLREDLIFGSGRVTFSKK